MLLRGKAAPALITDTERHVKCTFDPVDQKKTLYNTIKNREESISHQLAYQVAHVPLFCAYPVLPSIQKRCRILRTHGSHR
jgi:hypothetical protein